MRSSSTRRRRIAEEDSARPAARPRGGSAAARDNGSRCATSLRETLLSLPRAALHRRARSCSCRSACSPWPTVLLDPTPPKQVVAGHRPGPGRLCRVRQALRADPEGERHRGAAAADRRRGREPRPAARAGRRSRHRLRAGRRRRERPRSSADDADADGLVSLGSLFHEPVWLFYRGDAAERLLKAPRADRPQPARRLAGQHRRARQRRAQPDGAADRGQRHRPPDADAAPARRRRRRSSACSRAASTRSCSPRRPNR